MVMMLLGETTPRRLLVTSGVARIAPERLEQFSAAGFQLEYAYDLSGTYDTESVVAAVAGFWGVLAGTEVYSREVLSRLPELRAIARCGVGVDAIDLDAASELGVTVITTPGTNDESVAEFAVGLILATLGLGGAAGRSSLTGETVAIVGLGAIGLAVARRLRPFGCRILGVDPVADAGECHDLGIELASLDSALVRAGVLTLHAPLTSATRGLIGARELALMSSDATLVNTARGGVVDEAALARALATRQLRAAAIDVFEDEPLPPNHPLRSTPATLVTGHIAGMTTASVRAMPDAALNGLVDLSHVREPVRGALNAVAEPRVAAEAP
jgi:phosphoglycerate dehydrogenase-like enzyme